MKFQDMVPYRDHWEGHKTVYVFKLKAVYQPEFSAITHRPKDILVGIQFRKRYILTVNGLYSRGYYTRKRKATKRDVRRYE